MKWNPEAALNVTGRTRYLDDEPVLADCLFAAPVVAPCARGLLRSLDPARALALDPGIAILDSGSIPGENELGGAVNDEPVMVAAGTEWGYDGQTLALALAKTATLARKAASLVAIGYEELPACFDAVEAANRGRLILSPRTMATGDCESAFRTCAHVFSGSVEMRGQEHVYLETQGAIATPLEGGRFHLLSGTQSPSGVQRACARVLGLPISSFQVETHRLGGAFGGKEDQAAGWAALAAVGAHSTKRQVKLVLDRRTDMRVTGKRHPYSVRYRIGLDDDFSIVAYEADFYQNSGACTDLSPAILPRTLFHAASAYRIPNLRVTGYMCRTNLVPFTAFRGFGAPQGIFAIESAIDRAAEGLGVGARRIQERNLLSPGDSFHYGMPVIECRTRQTFARLKEKARLEETFAEIERFNSSHRFEKRGGAVIPTCFGISFTKLMMNQGGALVHVYPDGSASVATGGVEMGQGLNRKIARVAASVLGIDEAAIRVERTTTASVANTMPTAASSGTDLNGAATQEACSQLRERLLDFALTQGECAGADRGALVLRGGMVAAGGASTGLDFRTLVVRAHEARIDLTAHGFHSTPGLEYDPAAERGSPFSYHVYGAALVCATVDTRLGTYRFDRAVAVHDAGVSLDEKIDLGQVEGAFAQGLGWAALEDLAFDGEGRLAANSLAGYKLPDQRFLPELETELLADAPNPLAVMRSKAIGEPPFIYGIAGYFAVLEALRAARPGSAGFHSIPMTQEKVLAFLEGDEA